MVQMPQKFNVQLATYISTTTSLPGSVRSSDIFGLGGVGTNILPPHQSTTFFGVLKERFGLYLLSIQYSRNTAVVALIPSDSKSKRLSQDT
ncbi:uncharacterized protein H6S33_007574 [Morchella sextelata]|uniref:uncharacterized protein n=1 Tax=Morchella sextelata TaxID=1174677 RepID=UPI001D0453AE|nr:uncharacterized protein H6S33_007574 [Morchella sextelata]KAH0603915.1 hypothetical protein H6S33_007574 [Morchella sextelata]